jgi:hypothetical protein
MTRKLTLHWMEIKMKPWILARAALLAAVSISYASAAVAAQPPTGMTYPEADADLGERLYPNEEAIAGELTSVIEGTVRRQYKAGNARRDAHPKAHGCVTAEFRIDPEIPGSFAKGMFVPGKTYQAWIRFSNGNPDADKPDVEGNERGMSMKVLGVPGEKVLESEREDTTQDFIMMSHPAFFLKDASNAVDFFKAIGSESSLAKAKIPVALGIHGMAMVLKINSKKISNPLQTRYWSPVAYQLGLGPDLTIH